MNDKGAMLKAASAAMANAYAPYSNFAVGAAVQALDGSIHAGCNVENASFGLTCCAERNAIGAAVAGGMKQGELSAVLVLVGDETIATPCGACRQVIAEFAAPDCSVICTNAAGESQIYSVDGLLPDGFTLA